MILFLRNPNLSHPGQNLEWSPVIFLWNSALWGFFVLFRDTVTHCAEWGHGWQLGGSWTEFVKRWWSFRCSNWWNGHIISYRHMWVLVERSRTRYQWTCEYCIQYCHILQYCHVLLHCHTKFYVLVFVLILKIWNGTNSMYNSPYKLYTTYALCAVQDFRYKNTSVTCANPAGFADLAS